MVSESPARPGLDEWVHRVGLRRGCVAVHVRHGDSCYDTVGLNAGRKCHPFAAYRGHIDGMLRRYNLAQIYLATDDHAIAAECKAVYGDRVIMQARARSLL